MPWRNFVLLKNTWDTLSIMRGRGQYSYIPWIRLLQTRYRPHTSILRQYYYMYHYTDGPTNDGLLRVNVMSVTNSHQRVKGSSSVLDLCLHPVTPPCRTSICVQFPNEIITSLYSIKRCGSDLSMKCTWRQCHRLLWLYYLAMEFKDAHVQCHLYALTHIHSTTHAWPNMSIHTHHMDICSYTSSHALVYYQCHLHRPHTVFYYWRP